VAEKVDGALGVVFRESAQELVSQMDGLLEGMVYGTRVGGVETPLPQSEGYKRTGFLRASLVASTTAMPTLSRDNPGVSVPPDLGPVVLVINGADLGDVLYLGYTARYASFVHFGAQGRTPRPWVTMVAQRWEMIVAEKAGEVKRRLGL
jgi:hypothetical protein